MKTLPVVLAVMLLCGHAGGAAEKIALEVKEMPLEAVARMVAKKAGLTVIVAPDRAATPISIAVKDTPPLDVLRLAARIAGLGMEKLEDGIYWIGPKLEPWARDAHAFLATRKADFVNEAMGLEQVVSLIATHLGLNTAVDPDVTRSREADTLRVAKPAPGLTVREFLGTACESLDLSWGLRWGLIFVSTKERLATLPHYGMDPPPAPWRAGTSRCGSAWGASG